MTRLTSLRSLAPGFWRLPLLALALTSAACGDLNIDWTTPTPAWPSGSAAGIRNLHITGTLTAEQGACVEARILFDGTEIPGSTVECADAGGCTRLELTGVTTSESGRHVISLQVLRQPLETTVYVGEVKIQLTRDGLPFQVAISPQPTRATLRAGESVTFDLTLTDWMDS
jgi:hypothetical protein